MHAEPRLARFQHAGRQVQKVLICSLEGNQTMVWSKKGDVDMRDDGWGPTASGAAERDQSSRGQCRRGEIAPLLRQAPAPHHLALSGAPCRSCC